MNKIKDKYREYPFEIQVKAPMLFVVLTVFFGLSIFIIISDILSAGSLVDFLEHGLMMLLTLIAMLLVRKGKYYLVSDVYFSLITAIFIILRYQDVSIGDAALAFFTSIIGAFLVFSSVFIEHRRLLKVLVITYVLTYLGMILRIHLAGAWQVERLPVSDQIIFTAIAMISVSLSILMIRNVFDKVVASTREKMQELQSFYEKNQSLISESADQLGKAGQLQMEADSTLVISDHIQEHTGKLSEGVQHLNNRLENSGNALKVVDQAMIELREISEDQSAQVTESSASIEEMAASIANVSQIIKDRTDSVKELKEEADRGEETMNQTRGAFDKAASLLGNIRDMTDIISGIAAQTNLLAMNAAIEAAHAGDSGRGFAVVSSEIRKLAESSSQNAKRIEETIKEMVTAIERTGIQVDESGKAFKRLASGIDNVGSSMTEISRSTEELDTGSREILQTVGHLNDITQKVLEQVNNVARSSEKVASDLDEIRHISEETGSMSQSSDEEAQKLKKSSTTMQDLCRELLEQSMKLNAEMIDQNP